MSALDLFSAAVWTITGTTPPTIKRGRQVAFIVYENDGSTRGIRPAGRDAWALGEMMTAGATGCTPITHVGPRWSHYVWKLRTVYNLDIESVEEQHGGEFAGRHVRYVLRSRVRRMVAP